MIRATIIGRVANRLRLVDAIAGAGAEAAEVRQSDGTAWALLHFRTTPETVAAIRRRIGTAHVLIEVEMEGDRGYGLHGVRTTYPEGVADDRTAELRDTLREWRGDAPGGFDADEMVDALAWELIDADPGPDETCEEELGVGPLATRSQVPAESPVAAWARDAIDKLVDDGLVELTGHRRPYDLLIVLLERTDGEFPVHCADELIDQLVDDEDIAEVFADREQVAAAVRTTRPR